MIGTSDEMILYFSYSCKEFSVITTDKSIISRIRSAIRLGRVSEEQKSEWLTKLGCRLIRPHITIPAIIKDRYNRIFDEVSFVKYYLSEKEKNKIISLIGTCDIKKGVLAQRALKILLKHKKAIIDVPRQELPSVWSYAPVYDVLPQDTKKMLGKMIGSNPNHL